jgi:hypothetical protein
MNLDDAVIANLNPTEDYKTSVLSGLSPNIIMECTGRALSFFAYQTSQEMLVSYGPLIWLKNPKDIIAHTKIFLQEI